MEVLIGSGVALVAIALVLLAWRRMPPQPIAPRQATATASPAALPTAPEPASAAATGTGPQFLPDWPVFRPLRAKDLSYERRRQLLATHAALPRPSRLLDQLLSPEFINQASPRQLADLVAGEPLLAARVLKAVNAPFYGLPQPVNNMAQAVTYLGLTTVRITCLRYIFIAAFTTGNAQRQQAIDQLWQASAMASELVSRAAPALQLADAGRWSSAVLLSFLGRLAVLASSPTEHLPALCDSLPVRRAEAEQHSLGLCAAELGRLLMTEWGLPPTVVDDAADIEWLLYDAPDWPADGRREALALCALCVRLSERAVSSQGRVGPPLDFEHETAHDIACLRVHLGEARRAAIQAWLLKPAVQQVLRGSGLMPLPNSR